MSITHEEMEKEFNLQAMRAIHGQPPGEQDNLDQIREQVLAIEEEEMSVLKDRHKEMVFNLLSDPRGYVHRIPDNIIIFTLIRKIKQHAHALFELYANFCDENCILFHRSISHGDEEMISLINLSHCIVGVNTETAEILDVYKKIVFYNRGITDKNKQMYLEESGDLRFFLTGGWDICSKHVQERFIKAPWEEMCSHFFAINQSLKRLDECFGITERQSLEYNMWKLKDAPNARYKEGYSDQAATDRADKTASGDNALPDLEKEKMEEKVKKAIASHEDQRLREKEEFAKALGNLSDARKMADKAAIGDRHYPHPNIKQ